MQARGHFLPLRSLILPTRQIGVRKGQKWAFRVHHSTTFFSAFSCRRNAAFCPCNPGFCPFWFSPFDVFFASHPLFFWGERYVLSPLTETLRFFERAQRSPASAGKPLFFFSGERNVFSSPWSSFLFRGRRQLPQAGEVRRPPGPACVCGWFAYSFLPAT